MPLFKTQEEREAARAAKQERRRVAERAIENRLQQAMQAADAGDVVAEERAIGFAWERAREADDLWGRLTRDLKSRIERLTAEGKIRRSEFLGWADDIYIWRDRIVSKDGVHLIDEHVRASVDTAGQLLESKRPTLTRMAIGSVLPGTALIPGFAFQKKEVSDTRELFFVLEHSEWARVVKLDPQLVDEGAMRQMAVAINQAARAVALAKEREGEDARRATDAVEGLKKLADLRESGVLTEEEFAELKARLLTDEQQTATDAPPETVQASTGVLTGGRRRDV